MADGSFLPPRWQLASQVAAGNTKSIPSFGAGDFAAMGASAADPFGIPSSMASAAGYPGWQNLETAHPEASVAGSMLAPGAALPGKGLSALYSAAKANPKAAAALLGGLFASTPSNAGESGPGDRPTMTGDEQQQIAGLSAQIDKLNAARAKAIKGLGPKGAGVAGAPFDAQIKTLNDQIGAINGQVNERQTAYDQAKAQYDQQTAPWAEKYPNAAAAAHAAAFALSPLTGAWLGRKIGMAYPNMGAMKRAVTYGSSGLGGAIEGTLSALGPTQIDSEAAAGTRAKTQADASMDDPNFWKHSVAPEVGIAALESMLGTKYGLTSAIRPAVSAALPAAVSKAAPAASAAPSAPAKLFQDSAGRWREQGTGRFVSRQNTPQ